MLGLGIGYVVAARYHPVVSGFFGEYWSFSPVLLDAASFGVLFFLSYLVLNIIGLLLHRWANALFLGGLNRVGGVVIGGGKGVVFISLILFLLISNSWFPENIKTSLARSTLAPRLHELGEELVIMGKSFMARQETILVRKDQVSRFRRLL